MKKSLTVSLMNHNSEPFIIYHLLFIVITLLKPLVFFPLLRGREDYIFIGGGQEVKVCLWGNNFSEILIELKGSYTIPDTFLLKA